MPWHCIRLRYRRRESRLPRWEIISYGSGTNNKRGTIMQNTTTRRSIITGAALAMAGAALRPSSAIAAGATDAEVTYTSEAIHQERLIKASRQRVFQALTV